jgi:predicted amidohydrolase YtcJ
MGREPGAAPPIERPPEDPSERLARLLARPLDRRTFLVLSSLAVPAVLAACATGPSVAGLGSGSVPSAPPASRTPQEAADWVLVGGPILTMTAGAKADGIAVRGERVVAVGAAADMLDYVGAGTRLVDLAGRMVMPGFVDPHEHIASPVANAHGNLDAVEDEALSLGITSRGEAAVHPAEIDPILDWAAAREPRIRTSLYLLHNDNCGVDQGDWYRRYPATTDRSAKLRIAGVKIFSDGGSCGAPAVTFDYPNGVGRGDLYVEQASLTPLLEELSKAGYQAVIHSLGDRSLDVVQASLSAALAGGNPTRHRIDHNAVVRPDQLEWYGEQDGVLLVFGAFPACVYAGDTSHFKYLVPADKKSLEWRWRDLLDAAQPGHAGWHGDAPIFSLNPLDHLAGFVTRSDRAGETVCAPPDWALANRLDVDQALALMTIGSAFALDREADVGSLAVGKLADLIVLDRDPTAVPPEQLRDLAVQLTMVGGVAEYVRPGAEDLVPPPASTPPGAVSPGPSVAAGLLDVAVGKVATASHSLPDAPPSLAVDGDPASDAVWNAGGGPPQWIEVDLGAATPIAAVRLVVAQFPPGPTRHRVLGRATASGASTVLHEFAGQTADKDVLATNFDPPVDGTRYVRIETLESPSDVAWREIEVLSRPA